MTKKNILRKLDGMSTYEKIDFLNSLFLKSKSKEQDDMILQILKGVKMWG